MKIRGGPLAPSAPLPAADAVPAASVASKEPSLTDRARIGQKLGANAPSKVLSLLGKARFANATAVNIPGKITWFNPDLARAAGFDVPPSNKLTPALEAQLLGALCFRLLKEGEVPGDRTTMTVFADKYGGSGIGGNGGSGRAAFLPTRNLHVKGIGLTPLAKVDKDDFIHGHGGAPMREGFLEAIWGEVNDNLFTSGSTQVLAVIDAHDHTVWPDGTKEKRALIIRAGRQLRPGHLLVDFFNSGKFGVDAFVRATKDSGDLKLRDNGKADLAATMQSVIERHARTAAEQYRYRILHGAISTSNLELDGSMLDLATQTAQPRTAPIKVIGHGSIYGKEHEERGKELALVYDALCETIPNERKSLNAKPLHVRVLLDQAYEKALQTELVKATGVQSECKLPAAKELSVTLQALARLSKHETVLADKQIHSSTVDVFGMLRELPRHYFAKDPNLAERALALLQPTHDDPKIRELTQRFLAAYTLVMEDAASKAPNRRAFERAVTNRAAFENQPLSELYRSQMNDKLDKAIAEYERTGDCSIFKDTVDGVVARSLRSVDRLREQGVTDGEDMQKRTIAGVTYAVRHDSLHVTLPVENGKLSTLDGSPTIGGEIRYRFTTNGWKDGGQEVVGRLENGVVHFDIPMLPSEIGQLEGVFYSGSSWLKDRSTNFSGYVFAMPD